MPTGIPQGEFLQLPQRLFQSLFFWMMPTGKVINGCKKEEIMGFNPCSSGWCLPALPFQYFPKPIGKFQSLFFWMMPTGGVIPQANAAGWRFQSLFFWMMPTGWDWFYFNLVRQIGFNPCSSGWCLPAIHHILPMPWNAWFQSLFFWMMPTGQRLKGRGFGGEVVSILVLLDDAYRHWGCTPTSLANSLFQSLFFWMMPTGFW